MFGSTNSNDLPIPQVKALSERGYSENDIKDILRKKGYSENEINTTLQRALVDKVSPKTGGGILQLDNNMPSAPAPMQPALPAPPALPPQMEHHDDPLLIHGDTGNLFGSIGAKQEELSFERSSLPAPPSTPHEDHHSQEGYEIDLEPIVEAIVEEKWADTGAVISDLQERMDNMEKWSASGAKDDNVAQLEYLVKQSQERVERLEKALDDVTIKVNSIEKAFKQFIPSLTGNIKALSEAVRHIRSPESQSHEQ